MGNGNKKRILFALSAIALLVVVVLFVQRSKQGGSLDVVVVAPGGQEGAPVSDAEPVAAGEEKGAGSEKSNAPAEPGAPVLIGGGSDEKENLSEKPGAGAKPGAGEVGKLGSEGSAVGIGNAPVAGKDSDTLQKRGAPSGGASASKDQIEAGCRTLRFSHDEIASHKDGSLCLEHSNEISLPDDLKNPSFVCVRINDKVIDFKIDNKGPKSVVRFGPGAKVKSVVEVTACVKGAKACKGGCPKQKSRFVSSMGLDEEGARGKLDDQVEREYARLEAAIGAGAKELELKFKGWTFLNDVPGCKK